MVGAMIVKYEGNLPGWGKVPAARFNEVRRIAWEAVGNYWHDHFRKKHFTWKGAKEYGYEPRSSETVGGRTFWRTYGGRKQRYTRRNRPLIFTGKSEELTRTRKFNIKSRGSASSLQIVLNAPTLNRMPWGRDMRKEMTTVSQAEFKELIAVFEETITRLLQ